MTEALGRVATAHHAAHPEGAHAAQLVLWLGALVPRVMFAGGWTGAARKAGAEPLWTGRVRPYDESTLRKAAGRLDAADGWRFVAQAVDRQVREAVGRDTTVVAHTDMFDQPYYTKKFAHAAPIGRLGNRLLAATYFGVTTVALASGPALLVHLSWHKPAAPLLDAVADLCADPERLGWWHRHVRLHVVDRGANGDPALVRFLGWELPYLTIARQGADLWRFRDPTLTTELGLPVIVRRDARLEGTPADGPWVIVVPADPTRADSTRGLRFRTAAALSEEDLRDLNALYKTRWPAMENQLKALQAMGFGRNRTRALELTTSRGTDGKMARLTEREATLWETWHEQMDEPYSKANFRRVAATSRKLDTTRAAKAKVLAEAPPKHARPEGGAERLGKWLHMLAHNALMLALARGADESVRAMTPAMVFELLLGRSALTCIEPGRLTMWVDPVVSAEDRRQQAALIDLFNTLDLRCRGSAVVLRMHNPPGKKVV